MEYTIIYNINFEDFLYDVQQYIEDGWEPLGPPVINISKYRACIVDNRRILRHDQWYFHQALIRVKDKDENIESG